MFFLKMLTIANAKILFSLQIILFGDYRFRDLRPRRSYSADLCFSLLYL